jgi:hypothetical protein
VFDDHSSALPDHDVMHHLAEIGIGHHQISQHAATLTDVMELAVHAMPKRLEGASVGLADLIHGALSAADYVTIAHDAMVDAHHGFYSSPF